MSATPLIKKLNNQGGTLYAFSSAINQEQMAATNDDIKFSFSKFVTLNLSDIKTPTNKENNIQFLSIDGQIFDGLSPYNSINLIQSFQNYCLNLETNLINSSYYDSTILKTVSERVFFKWLKEIGAIRFKQADSNETTKTRFAEENTKLTGTTRYNRVVNYIGDIDIVNNVNSNGNNYTEVYLNISSLVGSTPIVLFDALEDDNYKPDMIITGPEEILYNRALSTVHPDNLSLYSYYDYDTNVDYINSTNANWYNQSSLSGNVNSYFTELTTFANPANIEITKSNADYSGVDSFTSINYLRSKLDGISIDFDPTSYYDIVNDSLLNSIQEYNSTAKSSNFEFNAVLIYYDIYNETNPTLRETNLYGILFLDNLVENVGESYIPVFNKYKFNKLTNQNGNSYGLRINLTSSQSIYNSGTDSIINDYNTFSMTLFSDTMIQLQNSVLQFQEQNRQIIDLEERISNTESLIYNINSITDLQLQINNLETMIDNAQIAFSESSILLNMIGNLNDRLNQILQNNTSIQLQYNTDVIQAGSGIELDKKVKDKFIINNKTQSYNICYVTDIDNLQINKDNVYDLEIKDPKLYIYLKEFTNYVKLYTIDNSILENYLSIYINDKNTKFKDGQSIKISFANNIDFASYDIKIFSDFNNVFGYGSLNKSIITINTLELSSKPLIEIICLDSKNYIFDYEILR